MVDMQRIRSYWSGFTGSPGISTMFALSATAAQTPIRNFWLALVSDLPTAAVINVADSGDIITDTSGDLTGGWVGATPSLVQGSDSGGFSVVTGYSVKWLTNTFLDGRRVHGRTFIVPASRTAFTAGGEVAVATINRAVAAGNALALAVPGNLVVWRRPRKALPAWTDAHGRVHPAVEARAGSAVTITGASCDKKAVVLRTRRT